MLAFSNDSLTFLRLSADLLGFSGALGIQVIVTSLQDDIRGVDIKGNTTMESTNTMDTLTIYQFISCRMVAAVMILLASLSQGSFSQVFEKNEKHLPWIMFNCNFDLLLRNSIIGSFMQHYPKEVPYVF